MTHDGFKSLAERCDKWPDHPWIVAIDAMFSELRADLVHAPSRAETPGFVCPCCAGSCCPHCGAQPAAKPSDVEVRGDMIQAALDAWPSNRPKISGAAIERIYRAMRALEPERPVEITEAMIERAITAGQGGDSWRGWASAKPYRDGMRRALEAALSTPPSEGEGR